MTQRQIILLLFSTLLLNSCFKEDEMLPAPPRGDVRTDTIAMGETYKYQVWFTLDSGSVVGYNVRNVSDIGFECSTDGWNIILNTSDFARVVDMGTIPFGEPCDTAGLKWRFDKSDGDPDSIAIGQWFTVHNGDTLSNNHVYLIDRGLDDLGNHLGIKQIIFDSLSNSTYHFRFTNWQGGSILNGSVAKDPSVNYLYFSLGNEGSIQPIEPPKEQWDLQFTQYTTLLFTDLGEAYPYLVTGVLINRSGVVVATDTLTNFQAIDLEKARQYTYSSAMDAIGYDWKYYNFDAGVYTILNNRNYIIRDHQGYYFKLRFIGFYNQNGEKGYPVIEYQRL